MNAGSAGTRPQATTMASTRVKAARYRESGGVGGLPHSSWGDLYHPQTAFTEGGRPLHAAGECAQMAGTGCCTVLCKGLREGALQMRHAGSLPSREHELEGISLSKASSSLSPGPGPKGLGVLSRVPWDPGWAPLLLLSLRHSPLPYSLQTRASWGQLCHSPTPRPGAHCRGPEAATWTHAGLALSQEMIFR